jgi:hypothetical protein
MGKAGHLALKIAPDVALSVELEDAANAAHDAVIPIPRPARCVAISNTLIALIKLSLEGYSRPSRLDPIAISLSLFFRRPE